MDREILVMILIVLLIIAFSVVEWRIHMLRDQLAAGNAVADELRAANDRLRYELNMEVGDPQPEPQVIDILQAATEADEIRPDGNGYYFVTKWNGDNSPQAAYERYEGIQGELEEIGGWTIVDLSVSPGRVSGFLRPIESVVPG